MDLLVVAWQRHGNDKQGPSAAARRFAEAMRLPAARRYANRRIGIDVQGNDKELLCIAMEVHSTAKA